MAANEVANSIHAQFKFSADNPPVLQGSVGVIASSLTRTGAGQYTIQLEEQVAGSINGRTVIECSANDVSAASFAACAEVPVAGRGALLINARNLAGALNDTGASIAVTVFDLPNVS
jgi:hypothetical protein